MIYIYIRLREIYLLLDSIGDLPSHLLIIWNNFDPANIIGGFIMAEKNNTGFLKIVLIIYAVVCLVYGLAYMIVPDALVNMSGGEPVFHGWLRWSGGILIALGIGSLLVVGNPKGQGIFVTTIALGGPLAGLALLLAGMTR